MSDDIFSLLVVGHPYIALIVLLVLQHVFSIVIIPSIDLIGIYSTWSIIFIILYVVGFILVPWVTGYLFRVSTSPEADDLFFVAFIEFGYNLLFVYIFYLLFGLGTHLNFTVSLTILCGLSGLFYREIIIFMKSISKRIVSIGNTFSQSIGYDATYFIVVIYFIIFLKAIVFSLILLYMYLGSSYTDILLYSLFIDPSTQILLIIFGTGCTIILFIILSSFYAILESYFSNANLSLLIVDITLTVSILMLILKYGGFFVNTTFMWMVSWNFMLFLIPLKGIPLYVKPILKYSGLVSFILSFFILYLPLKDLLIVMNSYSFASLPFASILGGLGGVLAIIGSKAE